MTLMRILLVLIGEAWIQLLLGLRKIKGIIKTGGTIDILQQLAQSLQRATQPAAVAPQRLAIERMARYRPVDFLGQKEDEPSMAENWLERTE